MGSVVFNSVLLWQALLMVHEAICHWNQGFKGMELK